MSKNITLECRNTDNETIYAPELQFAEDIRFDGKWPKGFGNLTFRLRMKDVHSSELRIKESYAIILYEGTAMIYDGRIKDFTPTISGNDQFLEVKCVGWYVILHETAIQSRWCDDNALQRLEIATGMEEDETINDFVLQRDNNRVNVQMMDRIAPRYLAYWEVYEMPNQHSQYIKSVTYEWAARFGEEEQLFGGVASPAHTASLGTVFIDTLLFPNTGTLETGTQTVTAFPASAQDFSLHAGVWGADSYNQGDWVTWHHVTVKAFYQTTHRIYNAETYAQAELVEDTLLITGGPISTDYEKVPTVVGGGPGFVLTPFVVEEPTSAGKVIADVLKVGDASLNVWGIKVLDRDGTSDDLPRVYLETLNTDDYEYVIQLENEQLLNINLANVDDDLINYVIVQYVDERGVTRYRTPVDNADLKDTTSIANEYTRGAMLSVGEATVTAADNAGKRWLSYRKDRKTRGGFTLKDEVLTKWGTWQSVLRIVPGERIKVVTGDTETIYFIRHVRCDVEGRTAQISPDMPTDNINLLLAQQREGLR